MASRLRIPALVIATISGVLSIAVISCAGRSYTVFNDQQGTNEWLLPAWPDHFDTRELQTQIGATTTILVLDIVIIATAFISSYIVSIVSLACSILSTIVAIVVLAFPSVILNRADGMKMDTLQTWTCTWESVATQLEEEVPSNFASLCRQTTFAHYASIPLFLLQLALLTLAIVTLIHRHKGNETTRAAKRTSLRLYDDDMTDIEKASTMRSNSTIPMNRMQQTRTPSLDSASAKNAHVIVRETRSAGFAG